MELRVRIKNADLKNKFWGFPCFLGVGKTAICCLEWLGRFKCLATGLDALLSSFSTSRRCSRNRWTSRVPVSLMYNYLQRVQVYAVDDIGWGTVEMISDLDGALRSWVNEKTCFASCACAFKISGLITCLECTWLKSYLCFCLVWLKLIAVAKRFYQYWDHFEVI